jgi:glycosyltransferase involved in cell wall biosynthesis
VTAPTGRTQASGFAPIVVIPVFNHPHTIAAMVAGVRSQGVPCLVVDDGSGAECADALDRLLAATPDGLRLLRLPCNQGKGGAVMAGLREAARLGYTHVLQIDADGQHQVADVSGFLDAARSEPDAVIVGNPVFDASVPRSRLYGRYATHVWVWINTLSFDIRDAMCGFRVYPLAPVLAIVDAERVGRRMDFDIEILVRLHWLGLAVRNRETRVIYPLDGVSHFDVWRDNLRISRMHATLFFGMLRRLPMLLWRRARR